MFDLTDRCALITGASGGIGGAIARQLHAQGATLVLSGTQRTALEALGISLGTRVFVLPCNLNESESVERLVPEAEAAMGRVDILVNSAGITRDTLILRMKDKDWTTVMDVNLTAAFRLSRAVVRGMMKRRFGRIVNITSIVGVTGNPGQVNYAAAKAGIIGMTKSLAAEVATRYITINCIAPGFITTSMTDTLHETQRNRLISVIPAGRFGVPEDIAAATLFLVSPEAGYITGQTLHINGGMAMV
ncbi:3-oxoacyl-[acyl-carrier protein] reductase [invertebrate metagenome]|uniref:3-oxoacyl-[acyl-carrier protein] reductase n=1 Tax=invertebrate metagenome TaxID=1711999 RepID=A0A484H4T6_9ZZZZ